MICNTVFVWENMYLCVYVRPFFLFFLKRVSGSGTKQVALLLQFPAFLSTVSFLILSDLRNIRILCSLASLAHVVLVVCDFPGVVWCVRLSMLLTHRSFSPVDVPSGLMPDGF